MKALQQRELEQSRRHLGRPHQRRGRDGGGGERPAICSSHGRCAAMPVLTNQVTAKTKASSAMGSQVDSTSDTAASVCGVGG